MQRRDFLNGLGTLGTGRWALLNAGEVLLGMPSGNASISAMVANRPMAPWPPPAGPLRVVVDTDAGREIDDQYALARLLGCPDRFRLEGIMLRIFGDAAGVNGKRKTYAEIQRNLEKARMRGKFPVMRGSEPIVFRDRKFQSESVDFIIGKAHTATPEDPLWLVCIGPATDAAAVPLKDPSTSDRFVIFWHGRTECPVRCWNFNAYNDILAARLLFD